MTFTRILLILFLFFSFQGVTFAQQSESSYGPFAIIQKDYIDLDGDGEKEVIELYARKNQYELANEWALKIDGKEIGSYDNKNDLYQLVDMKFVDVLQNGKLDILLYFRSIGSGGITGLTVLSHVDDGIEEIFTDPNSEDWAEQTKQRFSMKYTGDLQVHFKDTQRKLAATIPLSKQRYQDFPDKRELQKRLSDITTWVDPISDYRFEKLTKMKPQEIVTRQSISGIAHYDVIAYYETRYIFNKQQNKYIPTEVILQSTETGKRLAEEPY